ncbi:hypothetical protein XENORESO_014795 [Xenotaenia resolanae]|uniref:Uncharacterized protein n=1 Tax=Xenotaenia resolanae TaxID=208358 RepID=A0ABV0WUL7_9TELE
MLDLAQHRCSAAAKNQTGGRRSNFSVTPRRQQQQNSANSMMQPQHGGHTQQEPLPSHCVAAMSQGGPGAGVSSQPVPDPHQQGRPSSVSSQSSQQSMRSSSTNKHVPPSSATPSSYSLLQPLVPEVKEMNSGYTRLSANPMVGECHHTSAFCSLLAPCLLPVCPLTLGWGGTNTCCSVSTQGF